MNSPCQKWCDTLNYPHCSMAINVAQSVIFVTFADNEDNSTYSQVFHQGKKNTTNTQKIFNQEFK